MFEFYVCNLYAAYKRSPRTNHNTRRECLRVGPSGYTVVSRI